jgi:RNA polymerase-binding protein DksA
MDQKELDTYRQLLLKRRKQVLEDLGVFQEGQEEAMEANGDKYSTHIADEGSDTMSRELAYKIAAQGNKYLASINEALMLIDRGEYGTCVVCEKPIPRERLEAVPNAKMCVGCKSNKE